jgi:uncharacterized protein (DUF2267 family)
MDELIELVSEKTGISEEQATQAVETVMDYLKEHLPEPVADQIEGLLSGDVDTDSLMEGLGGLFGGKE